MSELRSENNEINIFSSSEVTSLLSIVSQDIFPLSWILWNTQRVKFFYSLMSYFVKKKIDLCFFYWWFHELKGMQLFFTNFCLGVFYSQDLSYKGGQMLMMKFTGIMLSLLKVSTHE